VEGVQTGREEAGDPQKGKETGVGRSLSGQDRKNRQGQRDRNLEKKEQEMK
jgi:hypothetical protein